jgi:hypothetical protein
MSRYEVPSDIKELFDNKECSYAIVDYGDDMEMDNNESMEYFISILNDYTDDNMVEDNGTMVRLKHPDYDYEIYISSGGLGDFFSHGFDVEIAER